MKDSSELRVVEAIHSLKKHLSSKQLEGRCVKNIQSNVSNNY